MPFKAVKDPGLCSVSHPFAVITVDASGKRVAGSKLHGCHMTNPDAQKQVRALYANVPDASVG